MLAVTTQNVVGIFFLERLALSDSTDDWADILYMGFIL